MEGLLHVGVPIRRCLDGLSTAKVHKNFAETLVGLDLVDEVQQQAEGPFRSLAAHV